MDITWTQVYLFAGFILAAYAIVANDAIQTLGTFLSSNAHRPWWVLWLYASSILVAVLVYGWWANYGDVAYGRLEKFPEPTGGISWIHVIPPIFILLLTRYGVPVSTTFLILAVFAPTNTQAILMKSALGYVCAFFVGILVYIAVSRFVEKYFMSTDGQRPGLYWVALQFASTGFLWSQWLIQDLANIFVYLPRQIGVELLIFAVVLMLLLHALLFARRGGAIQKIVRTKTNAQDIRSATIIDFLFGFILLFFKEFSNLPMSTTWVFLGLLAGREIALSFMLRARSTSEAFRIAGQDAGKALVGLAVSLALALGLPRIAAVVDGGDTLAAAEASDRTAAGNPDEEPALAVADDPRTRPDER